jgi:hypothetical protein
LTIGGEELTINATYASIDSSIPYLMMTERDFGVWNQTMMSAY